MIQVGDEQYTNSDGEVQIAYGWYHCYNLARNDVKKGTNLAAYNADSLAYLAMGMFVSFTVRMSILLSYTQRCTLSRQTLLTA